MSALQLVMLILIVGALVLAIATRVGRLPFDIVVALVLVLLVLGVL